MELLIWTCHKIHRKLWLYLISSSCSKVMLVIVVVGIMSFGAIIIVHIIHQRESPRGGPRRLYAHFTDGKTAAQRISTISQDHTSSAAKWLLNKNNTHTKHVLSSSGWGGAISPWSTELSGKCFPPSEIWSPLKRQRKWVKLSVLSEKQD